MTDEKLIARLREGATWDDDVAAADRIEALIKERDEAVHLARLRKTFIEEARDERDALEVKLAAAVEIGNKMAHSIEGNYYLPNIAGEWRKVAAEIKGESHD
jgi:hypothetical protein